MKKLNKFFAVLVALAMMAMLCVSMAFAEGETTSKDAKLVKYLYLAEGVNVPTDTFEFTFTGVETNTITKAEADVVAPTEVKIATSEMSATVYKDDGATVAKAISVADLFDMTQFTKPGVYKYTVTEKQTGTASINNGTMTYNKDSDTYTVSIYVTKNTTTNKLEISNIVVQDENGDKEDATNDPTVKDDTTVTEDKNLSNQGFTFKNSYTKAKSSDDADGVLKVSKEVSGDMADETLAFPFTVTLTIPDESSVTTATYYKNGAETGTDVSAATGEKTISFDVDLKHGEYIVFKTLPAGTKVSVTENLAKTIGEGEAAEEVVKNHDQWTAKATLTDVKDAADQTSGTKGASYTPAGLLIAENDTKNIAAFENVFEKSADETPTGILISNLPYIALALVAIGGLVAYVVVRRKGNEEA